MATVYRALDVATQRHIALKVLKRELSTIPEASTRFRREGELLLKLDHPGLVRIETFGTTEGGQLFLAMELLDGETLGARLKRLGRLEARDLGPVVAGICAALAFAHARGVIHRDLKPENVFLALLPCGDERVKVLDFGISKVFGAERLTQTGELLGTPRYMAPEQLSADHDLDARVDIYALGVMLYECLTGTAPFAGRTPSDLIVSILHGRAAPLRSVRPDVAPEVEGVVARAMARAREARFSTPEELASAFLGALGRPSGPGGLRAGAPTVALGSMEAGASPPPPLAGALPVAAPPRPGAATIVTAPSQADAVRPGTFSALPMHAAPAFVAAQARAAQAAPPPVQAQASAAHAAAGAAPSGPAVAGPPSAGPGAPHEGTSARHRDAPGAAASYAAPSAAGEPYAARAGAPHAARAGASAHHADRSRRYEVLPEEPLTLPTTRLPRVGLVLVALLAGAVSAGAAIVAVKWFRAARAEPAAASTPAPAVPPAAARSDAPLGAGPETLQGPRPPTRAVSPEGAPAPGGAVDPTGAPLVLPVAPALAGPGGVAPSPSPEFAADVTGGARPSTPASVVGTRGGGPTGRARRERDAPGPELSGVGGGGGSSSVGGPPVGGSPGGRAGATAAPAPPAPPAVTGSASAAAEPQTVPELLAAARAALARRDYPTCIARADEALAAGAPAIALRVKGDCLAGAGQTAKALEAYRRFCAMASDHPAIGETRARAEALGGSCP
jgi:serine/threonine-protein kinase